ncbi:DUF1774-domain-containing protein [Ceratocystis lukuohia]|uniref:ATP synthase F0 n=3 Tax=Ceratocystis TaxID=5157 RepID=A0A0F8D067_CERFI|nr:hypothetical protein CFO_g1404 [Ceratocystis platani]PHH56010.1 hypothetical protein CFIMG_001737RA [Ceratocystis fimbriata CBS 114723]
MSSTVNDWNPFSRRDSYTDSAISKYRIWTSVSFLVSAISTCLYVLHPPGSAHSIWWWNHHYRTAFSLNSVIVNIYWAVMFINQATYMSGLWTDRTSSTSTNAAALGSHFIINNILNFFFVILFANGHFLTALLVQIINLFNLSALYHRHNSYARWMHWPVVSGPLAWTIFAILWTGAIVVPWGNSTVLRILGNIAIWALLPIGLYFLAVFSDYTMGFSLAVLTWALAMGQFLEKLVSLQWIFAFVIMGLLFIASFMVAVPAWTGRRVAWLGSDANADNEGERRPLIPDQQV